VRYDESGEMDRVDGALPGVTQRTATNGKMKVEDRRNRNRVREIMSRLSRPGVNRGVRQYRTIVIRVRWISVIARRIDSVRGAIGQLHVRRRRLQAQLGGCKR